MTAAASNQPLRKDSKASKLIAYLKANPGSVVTYDDAAEVMGCPPGSVHQYLGPARNKGLVVKVLRDDVLCIALPEDAPTEEPAPFSAGLWSDGELSLHNAPINDAGDVVLTPAMVDQVRKLLCGGQA